MTLGNRIAQNRKRLNMTQDQLAEKLGITAQAVSKWENDLSCPDISTLPALAEIFGITIDELLGREAPQKVYVSQVVQEDLEEEDPDEEDGWVFQWDGGRRSSLGFALWVVLLGGLLLADNLLHLGVGFWSLAWPSFLLMMGLFHGRRFSFGRLCFVLLGGYFLADNLGLVPIVLTSDIVWPGLVILFGLSLVLDALKKPKKSGFHFSGKGKGKKSRNNCFADERSFRCDVAFVETDYLVTVENLEEGCVDLNFGELTVDLTGCRHISQPCRIHADCSFGELTLLVPRQYRVELSESAAFGSVDVEGHHDENPEGTILVDADASFGEITLRYV